MNKKNFNQVRQAHVLNLAGAIRLCKQLLGYQTPLKTIERSLVGQHGISLHDARLIIRTTRNRTGGHVRRHPSKKEN